MQSVERRPPHTPHVLMSMSPPAVSLDVLPRPPQKEQVTVPVP